jgi:hypothetical protein
MLFDTILVIAFIGAFMTLLLSHEEEIEDWRKEQMRRYR